MRKGTFELGSYVAIEHDSESANGDSITLIVYDKVTGEHAATALTSGEVRVLIDVLRGVWDSDSRDGPALDFELQEIPEVTLGWDANGSPV